MNANILRNLALALSLSIAPIGLAAAQEDAAKQPLIQEGGNQQMQQDETGAAVEGEAGATVEGQAGNAEAPRPEGETGVTAQDEAAPPPEGEAGAAESPAPEDEAGTAEAPAQEQETDATAEGEAASDEENGTAEAPATEEDTNATAEDEPSADTAEETAAEVEVTGSIDITAEQKTEIAQMIQQVDVEPADVDFELAVGTAIPATSRVALHIVPDEIVRVVPQFRHHLHFVAADNRVVIVDPCSLQVVAIIA